MLWGLPGTDLIVRTPIILYTHHFSETDMKSWLKRVYEDHYRTLMLIPFLLVLLAMIQIGTQYAITGDFVHRGITLKGGSTITLEEHASFVPEELEQFLRAKFPSADISVRTLGAVGQVKALAIDSDAQEEQEIAALVAAIREQGTLQESKYAVEIVGSSLGNNFFRQTITALLVAFVLMGIVVFLYFRSPIPSLAVILAGFSNILVTLAIFNLTGIKLTTAGVAAFLMLVGYSVDTDMLLTTRVLRRKEGTVMDRVYGAVGTGLTMTFTSLSTTLVGYFFIQNDVIRQMMLILSIGLAMDMIMTWIQNVGVLRLYLEKKKHE